MVSSQRSGLRRGRAAGAAAVAFVLASTHAAEVVKSSAKTRVASLTDTFSDRLPLPETAARTLRGGWMIESGPVEFGEIAPGEVREMPGAIRVRVFSPGSWTLKLVPETPLRIVDRGGEAVPASRLEWRSDESGGFRAFRESGDAIVARGKATRKAGALVVVDLRMALDASDALGVYGCRFRVVLESL